MADSTTTGVTPGVADYTIQRELGAGGVGRSFLAVAPARLNLPGVPVVVRVLRAPADDERAANRLLAELGVIAGTGHDRLAPILDAGQDGPFLWLTRPWFPAGSLAEPGTSLHRADRISAVIDAARAAHALHEAGVAHRRISPSNVVLFGDGSARLTDPGLGHHLVPGRTLSATEAVRSAGWLDPAAIRGERPGRATDLWSLGLLLLHALTGRHPAVQDTAPQRAVLHALRTPPNAGAGLAPTEAALVRSCLEPDPGRRPATAAEVADRMETLAHTVTAAAPPPPPPSGPVAAQAGPDQTATVALDGARPTAAGATEAAHEDRRP